MGLSIVETVVDAHGGEITLISAPGVGTTVRVELPVRPAAAISATLATAPLPH